MERRVTTAPPTSAVRAHLLVPGAAAQALLLPVVAPSAHGPLVSCIMATHGRLEPARHAIACFDRQTHPDRELVIACAAAGSAVEHYVADRADPRIRFVAASAGAQVGTLRNAAVAVAEGTFVCVWDDDDLSHPRRLAWQLAGLHAARAEGCLLARVTLWWPARRRLALSAARSWENSLLVARAALPLYPDLARGSDTVVVEALRASHRLVALDLPEAYCYVAHGGNLWGERHFEMLFDCATASVDDTAYDATLAALSATLPIRAYPA